MCSISSMMERIWRYASRSRSVENSAPPLLATITLDDIANGLDENRFTSVDLVQAYIARINEVNRDVNAVLEINPDAITIAHDLDNERRCQGRRGPLHGVPILLKDNIFTLDRMNTSAGSYALLGSKVVREGTVVERLRSAGAILLGKTNLSEWSNFRSKQATDGWSARGGQTYAPFVPLQAPEGSSSGSAVSTILGLAAVSLGTETDGSIVGPSKKNSVVGFRTTTGLVPRDGVIPLSDRQDTVGPIARTVKDAVYILSVIAGPSDYDNVTSSFPFAQVPDYLAYCRDTNLTGIRLGVPRSSIASKDPYVLETFERALQCLRNAGASVVDNVKFRSEHEWMDWDLSERKRPLEAEFKASIERWCGALVKNPHNITNVADIIQFIESEPRELSSERDVGRLISSRDSPGIDAEVTQAALEKMLRCSGKDGILGALEDYNVDALVFPNEYNLPSTFAARAGMPVFALPLGFYPEGTQSQETEVGHQVEVAPNVPFGLLFTAEHYSETKLIRLAYAFEQLWSLNHLPKPYIQPKTELKNVIARRNRVDSRL
ncbi:glutamyl-tRNA amidotransferase subunit A [Xylaria bambusicola]|uniref:glutamyl-tRNA amidotransferase subunit A n=1 Tax=Xylaria bambusicola TaxID=326684 RepID=UPI002007F3EB|nr:glutamyl-tRNA amidotransferase subunit A [Xylaria bambusicola]KAI0506424.1 glutamyl-tRNA amidotransferase subunit A [Xylaria bambusicola]